MLLMRDSTGFFVLVFCELFHIYIKCKTESDISSEPVGKCLVVQIYVSVQEHDGGVSPQAFLTVLSTHKLLSAQFNALRALL
jgi:hypothetical protein